MDKLKNKGAHGADVYCEAADLFSEEEEFSSFGLKYSLYEEVDQAFAKAKISCLDEKDGKSGEGDDVRKSNGKIPKWKRRGEGPSDPDPKKPLKDAAMGAEAF